jgi:alpha-beta hydrolase superfamily lysophospholipase
VIVEVLFLTVFWLWVATAVLFLRNTVLPRLPVPTAPFETVQFPSTDGLQLEGWKITSDPEAPWLIICHGLGTNRADLLDIAQGLVRRQFNVLLFDFRAHGSSQGRVTSFGFTEQRDLEGALAYLGSQPDIPARPYGFYGISMGAVVGLSVAARDERLGAVAVDSPYTSLDESLAHHLKLMYPILPRYPFAWFLWATYRLRFGTWPQHVSSRSAAAQLNGRPLLLIQGEADPRMSVDGAKQIFGRASEPKELWLIPGASHLEGYALNPDAYLKRLIAFFDKFLRPAPTR